MKPPKSPGNQAAAENPQLLGFAFSIDRTGHSIGCIATMIKSRSNPLLVQHVEFSGVGILSSWYRFYWMVWRDSQIPRTF
jgi:hypothetical protein